MADAGEIPFTTHRSVIVCKNGCVASSQPLASQIGVELLKRGGNAADVAVGVAAALNLTEPCSTGIGGDAFCLYFDVKTAKVSGLNGSGRSPSELTLDLLNQQGFDCENEIPRDHGHTITVPGAATAWVDTVERFGSGKLSMSEILGPAISLAENGFPVQKITAHSWSQGSDLLKNHRNTHGKDLLINGRAPLHGEVISNPYLANVFRELATKGKSGFYEGRIAAAIVEAVRKAGGVMSLDDLKTHESTVVEPISVDYNGYTVWEIPPNGQGITALMALNILEGLNLKDYKHNSAQYLHIVIEALRLSFADASWHCADPSQVDIPIKHLLSKDYAASRRQLLQPDRAIPMVTRGKLSGSDTVYFSVTDGDGNACSFINSNYMGFGTGIVPQACGFTLQNRGLGFSLESSHPNVVAPRKRPYHTIIPAMVTSTSTGELLACYGVMGGFMQPQGHVQVLLNMIEFGMDPQQALDMPRFCIGHGHRMHKGSLEHVALEAGIEPEVVEDLKAMGHNVTANVAGFGRAVFGRGQIIARGTWPFNPTDPKNNPVYWAGSDPRADGCAIGF